MPARTFRRILLTGCVAAIATAVVGLDLDNATTRTAAGRDRRFEFPANLPNDYRLTGAALNSLAITREDAIERVWMASLLNSVIGEFDPASVSLTGSSTLTLHNPLKGGADILTPHIVLPTICPGNIPCTVIAEKDCRISILNRTTGVITAEAGGTCDASVNLVGTKLSDHSALPPIEGIGVDNGEFLIGLPGRIVKVGGDWLDDIIEAFAGTGTAGFDGDGADAKAARLRSGVSLLGDLADDFSDRTTFRLWRSPGDRPAAVLTGILIADRDNHRIRRIAPDGTISTVAGSSAALIGDGGPATAARLRFPECVSKGEDGAFYICDTGQHRIRRVDGTTGIITTVAGTGVHGIGVPGQPAIATPLASPIGVVRDRAGNLWIAESGRISTVRAGTGVYEVAFGSRAQTHTEFFADSTAVAGDEIQFSQLGDVATVIADADGAAATLQEVLIADYTANRIRSYNPTTDIVATIAGTGRTPALGEPNGDGGPAASALLTNPYGIAVTGDGRIVFAELATGRIREIVRTTGVITTIAGGAPCPIGTTFDNGDGGPATAAILCQPMGVAVDPAGNVYWTEQGSSRVRMLMRATGIASTVAGTGTPGDSGDGGPAAAAQLRVPFDVDYDAARQRLVIADTFNHRVREVDLTQSPPAISTIAGTAGFGFSGDGGQAAQALLNTPYGVKVINGQLYVADTNNHRIRRVAPLAGATPIITTVAGTGRPGRLGRGETAAADGTGLRAGPALSARLWGPAGIAAGPNGAIVLAESGGRDVVVVEPAPAPPAGPPGVPQAFTIAVNGSLVTFDWTPPATGAPPTHYNLFGRATAAGPIVATLPIDGSLTSVTFSVPNGSYFATLQAGNALGVGPETAAVPVAVPQVPAPPGVPGGLAVSVSGATASFTWTTPTTGGPIGTYTLVASGTPGGAPIAVLPFPAFTDRPIDGAFARVTSRSVSGPPGTYFVRLFAANAGGNGPLSNQVTVVLGGVPGAPVLGGASVFQRTVSLSWTPAGTGAAPTQYLVTAAYSPGGPTEVSLTVGNTSLTVPNVPPGTYYVRVQGANNIGIGPASNEITVVVP